MTLQLAGVKVAHPLLVVTNLSFPILVGTDILRAHSATMSFGNAVPLRLNARVCDVCLEQQTELSREFWCAPPAVCTTYPVTIPPRTTALVRVLVTPRNPAVAVSRCRASRIGNFQARVRDDANSVRTSRRHLLRCDR